MATQSLQHVSTSALRIIQKGEVSSAADIVRAELAARDAAKLAETPKPVEERLPAPKPTSFTVSGEEREALIGVLSLIDGLPKDLPTTPATLTDEQREHLVRLFDAEKSGVSVLERVLDGLRTLIQNDETIRAEARGVPDDAARDKHGHLIPADKKKYTAAGLTSTLSIEPTQPKVSFDAAALVRLSALANAEEAKVASAEQAGEEYTPRFTRKQFNRATRTVRVWNDDAALKMIQDNPQVTSVFAEVASTKVGSVSYNKR